MTQKRKRKWANPQAYIPEAETVAAKPAAGAQSVGDTL